LSSLPRLDRKNALRHSLPCKVCGSTALFFDVVDFNKVAGEANCYTFGPSDVPVVYHRCSTCGLLFTSFFDDWDTVDFRRFVYNADYAMVDVEYAEQRPRRTAERIAGMLGDLKSVCILDYGSGSGVFAGRMAELGFKDVQEYDPFSHPTRPMGPFDVIVCNEVLEHSPDPLGTMGDMKSFLGQDGFILLGESLQPADIERVRANWWYCAPRNGHCSTFAERTLAIMAARLGLVFHGGDTLIFRLPNARMGIDIARRVNSPDPCHFTTLFAPSAPSDSLHSTEQGQGPPFRWTARQRLEWTINIESDSPVTLEVRIPFVMEVEPGFAAKCAVLIGDEPAQVSIAESSIVAEARRVNPGTATAALLMPEHKSPAQLRGSSDNRMLGLALQVAGS
jgi:Methyltransferase domain